MKITIPQTNLKLLKDIESTFSYFDSDYDKWELNDKGNLIKETTFEIKTLTEYKTFAQIFNKEKDCLTQAQLVWIIENKKNELLKERYKPVFFLVKNKKEFFVFDFKLGDAGLRFIVRPLSGGGVWCGGREVRFGVLAETEIPSEKTLEPSDTLTLSIGDFTITMEELERSIDNVKKAGYQVSKIY